MEKVSCLCGKVKISVELKNADIQACHCKQCQVWTGGGPLYVAHVNDIHFDGTEYIQTFHASEHGERGFCRACGTTLYWSMRGEKPSSIPVGLLDDQSKLKLSEEIFVDRRPAWLSAAEGANQSSEDEQLALLERYQAQKKS